MGFFNHAVAGLSEIIGIIFLSFVVALITIIFKGIDKQSPLIYCIFVLQFLVSINFWRYVITNKTRAGFDIEVFSGSSTSTNSVTLDYVAKGFGKEIV